MLSYNFAVVTVKFDKETNQVTNTVVPSNRERHVDGWGLHSPDRGKC